MTFFNTHFDRVKEAIRRLESINLEIDYKNYTNHGARGSGAGGETQTSNAG